MKQVLTILILFAILWVGFSQVKQQIRQTTVRSVPVDSDLTIDGHAVTEVFAFTNGLVVDGDSVRLAFDNGEEIDLRLASIDAPELRQNFGTAARQHLQRLVSSNEIIAWQIGVDKYQRRLVFLFIEQPDGRLFEINAQMIRDGFAWHYKQHSTNSLLDSFEFEARAARLGLWSDSSLPVTPWEFRRN